MSSEPGQSKDTAESPKYSGNPEPRTFRYRIAAWWRDMLNALRDLDGLLIAIATFLLAWIAFWQWDALVKTDQTLQRTVVIANRAFVFFAPPEFALRTDAATNTKKLEFTVRMGNSGQTPTKDMGYKTSCIKEVEKIDDFFDRKHIKPYLIGPKVSIAPIACSFDASMPIDNSNNVFRVVSVAYYKDTLNEETTHTTEQCMVVTIDPASIRTSNPSVLSVPCETAKNHNCADNECKEK